MKLTSVYTEKPKIRNSLALFIIHYYYNSKILVFLREHLCYLYVRTAAKIAAQHPFYTSTRNTERVSWPS